MSEPIPPPAPGQVWVNGDYRMTVRGVTADGFVLWDGVYDRGYETQLRTWNAWMTSGRWQLARTPEAP